MIWKRFVALYALAALLVLAAPAATAQTAAPVPAGQAPVVVARPDQALPSSVLGALAAVGCGVMVRATIVTGGTQVGTIAGAVACCGYMLLDAFVLDKH